MKLKTNREQLQALHSILWIVKLGDNNRYESALSDFLIRNEEVFAEVEEDNTCSVVFRASEQDGLEISLEA